MKQEVDTALNVVTITVKPDERYITICHKCQKKVKHIHSYHSRRIRDLNVFDAKSFISVAYCRLRCPHCGNVVEDLPLMNPYERVTRRLTTYILELCKYMTIKKIAEHLDLDWKTIKEIHKRFLHQKYSHEERGSPKILFVDEISIRKRHRYLTIIADWESGRGLGV